MLKDLVYTLKERGIAQLFNHCFTVSDIARGTRTVINFEHLGKIATALEIDDIRKIIVLEKQ